jgi:nucleoside 2-deoxyribosyltransferase
MAKRIFIAFAKEDERIRDLIKGQSLHVDTDFEYVDMSVKEPYDTAWKDHVRTRIKGSDGVIALLSKNTPAATGELWEIGCAIEESKPLLGLYIFKDDRTKPTIMNGQKCIVWTWDGLAEFINGL